MANLVRILPQVARRTGVAQSRSFSALLSASEEFPGIPSTSPAASSASNASVTTLPNGLTVVSEDASSTSTVSLTFPEGGSASESASEAGAALANKFLAFKSGSGLSSAVILRNLENDGATPFSTSDRTSATVGFTASKDKALRLVPLLATSCAFEKWDIVSTQGYAKVETAEANSNALTVLSEGAYAAAFGQQSAMGKTYYAESVASARAITSFRQKAYNLNGAVLAATGISDHESFVKAVEEGMSESDVGTGATHKSIPAFMGGETRINSSSAGYTHLALAFPSTSSSALDKVVAQCLTLASEGALTGFSSAGIIGVYGGSSPSEASATTDGLTSIITTAPSADVISRSIALAKADAIFALDDGSVSLAQAMTGSVLESGTFSAAGVAKAYDDVKVEAVKAAIEGMAKTAPAMVAVGDLSGTPYHGSIATRFA